MTDSVQTTATAPEAEATQNPELTVNDLNAINTIAKRSTQSGETIHNEPFPVTASMVADALRAADALAGQV